MVARVSESGFAAGLVVEISRMPRERRSHAIAEALHPDIL